MQIEVNAEIAKTKKNLDAFRAFFLFLVGSNFAEI